MAKKQVRLTESELKNLIKGTVQRFLKENIDELSPEFLIHAAHAAAADKKKHPGRGKDSKDPEIRAKRDRQIKSFGDTAADRINNNMNDRDFLTIGDRAARRMMYANGKNTAYLTNDLEDLDSVKLYNDDFKDGDEPLTIGSLPDDERARIHDRFAQFKGYHDRAKKLDDKYLEEKVSRIVRKTLRRKLNEMADPDVVAKAKELYKDVEWEDYEINDQDGGFATGTVWGGVEDDEGGVWEFVGAATFLWEGDWRLDTVEEVEFTSPDGQEGWI